MRASEILTRIKHITVIIWLKIKLQVTKLCDTKFKKTLLIIAAAIILLILAIILFISPLSKYLVQKYDLKYLGREITMDYAYVNPFTGYVYFHNVNIREANTDSLFLSVKGLSANFEMHKLLAKTFEISHITLDQPKGFIVVEKGVLNFQDVITRFSSENSEPSKQPLHLSILQIAIINGDFIFKENQVPVNYTIKKVNILSDGFKWDSDSISGTVSLKGGKTGGDLAGSFSINYKTLDYQFSALAQKFDLEIINQYLNELSNFGSFRAYVNADLHGKGNFHDKEDIVLKGILSVNDMHFGKDSLEDYAAFDKLIVSVTELSPKYHKYQIDSLILHHPFLNYERYDYLDNFEYMFGKKGAKIKNVNGDSQKFNLIIEVVRYVKVLVKNFFHSSYKINKLEIIDADLKYEDYTLAEKFSASAKSLHIFADSIDKTRKKVELQLTTNIKPYGNANLHLSINPKDSSDFDLEYGVSNIPLTHLNPFLIKYTSFPMDRGTIEIKGAWHVRNGEIQSKNQLVVIDPRIGERVRNDNNSWLPMHFAMFFVRERGNVIDYDIPISGNLKNPTFHYKDVIINALKNSFLKPATVIYREEVKENEKQIERSLSLKWNFLQESLLSEQIDFLEELATLLKSDPTFSISINPEIYIEKEKEYILFFEAKKKYFLSINKVNKENLTINDLTEINVMSNKDSMFVNYVNSKIQDPMLFTLQDKCLALVTRATVNSKYDLISQHRREAFMFYFTKLQNKGQFKLLREVNKIPYNGYSSYRIRYTGKIPESLRKASERINEMNNETPRKEFKGLRKKTKFV
ncbi:DUF748 domain-containing protein [Aurantibacillus circumpalustris]|uniref:DUF748 domain-containing protein n=1 Tax=Aurantibacillus circumpalustris TaxID=3036359 RepID=UPI00295B7AE0|nr:DUF748 domain-containing protein [Aurantibacillus circumpalustris]